MLSLPSFLIDKILTKKLQNGSIITVSYIITDGKDGNGASHFSFSGRFLDANNSVVIPTNSITVTTNSSSANGGDIEPVDSIKYFAPRLYSSQYRAVTARDYEAVIQSIYPNTESVSVVGGEELEPPQFGNVFISIKPKNGDYVSDFDKQTILNKLKNYTLSGINQKILDLKVLYVEIDSAIYYNTSQVTNVNCYGSSTGIIDIDVNGGISPYSYQWSNAVVTEDNINIIAGTYSVTVTDQFGCTVRGRSTVRG